MNQQSKGKYVAPLGHTRPIPTQPTFTLTPWWCVLSREAANIYFIVFGSTRPGLEPTIYRTWVEHTKH